MSDSSSSHYNGFDRLILQFDQALRTIVPGSSTQHRVSPADAVDGSNLSDEERRQAASLMRINHTGEVCAQALYQGQALTAKLPDIRQAMEVAAQEEVDHLAWCEQRLQALDSHTSVLNPAWYALSFGLGAAAGLAGDNWSLGFVAETESQVCDHLRDHLGRLPTQDHKSRAVLEQMLIDEQHHGDTARQAGGSELPAPIKLGMHLMSQVMKKTAYRF
ncbi:MAG: 2-polyprenyl-3-methyl-6-methoxy-1,4-benzoquinone monooxygenase [Pseudomonadales bacterium]|nr:2-polyprenyl-3-methyl-6-methoxy-1,4-benzoquinone monooxygenase [Pseudomonadales bacterium]MCP5329623.1 2-polyprenyl-3-methyl-6-methoxy-1,4-benzoquinone monooxygenase [Pseudomonadales bacterium]MCP5343838.1 2-polyprenyl-3-methyl-6-methoxy-1,4-benzoquinone monooxygenase [Pseudomonadales bacterium]